MPPPAAGTTWRWSGLVPAVVAAAAVLAGSLLQANASAPPDIERGAQISTTCAACHGSDGMSVGTNIPNLAGQHYVYLVRQIKAFRNRSRVSPLMNEMARTLTDQEIKDIAAYYASVPIKVGPPLKPRS